MEETLKTIRECSRIKYINFTQEKKGFMTKTKRFGVVLMTSAVRSDGRSSNYCFHLTGEKTQTHREDKPLKITLITSSF